MKLSSLASRVLLPIPVAFAFFVLFTFIFVGLRWADGNAPFPEPSQWLVIILIAGAIQAFIGVASIHLLRRKPLWTHAVTGLGMAIVISVFSGEMSLFGAQPDVSDPNTTAKPEFEPRAYIGMLGLIIPAMVIGYCLTWWRFTLVPRQKHRRQARRDRRGRKSREEIANTDISDHKRSLIPNQKPSRRKKRRTG